MNSSHPTNPSLNYLDRNIVIQQIANVFREWNPQNEISDEVIYDQAAKHEAALFNQTSNQAEYLAQISRNLSKVNKNYPDTNRGSNPTQNQITTGDIPTDQEQTSNQLTESPTRSPTLSWGHLGFTNQMDVDATDQIEKKLDQLHKFLPSLRHLLIEFERSRTTLDDKTKQQTFDGFIKRLRSVIALITPRLTKTQVTMQTLTSVENQIRVWFSYLKAHQSKRSPDSNSHHSNITPGVEVSHVNAHSYKHSGPLEPRTSTKLTQSQEIIIDEATCPVCLETMKDAISLDCPHSLCEVCATRMAQNSLKKNGRQQLSCPLCKKITKQSSFRPNLSLRNILSALLNPPQLIDEHSHLTSSTSSTLLPSSLNCEWCEKVPAYYECDECSRDSIVKFCQKCCEEVHSKSRYRQHAPTAIDDSKTQQEPLSMCINHNKKEDLFCSSDKKIICVDCAQFGGHKDHICYSLKKASSTLFESNKRRMEEGAQKKEYLEKTAALFFNDINQLKKSQMEAKIKVQTDLQRLAHNIKMREHELLQEIDRLSAIQNMELQQEYKNMVEGITMWKTLELKMKEIHDRRHDESGTFIKANLQLEEMLNDKFLASVPPLESAELMKESGCELIVEAPSKDIDVEKLGSIRLKRKGNFRQSFPAHKSYREDQDRWSDQ
eukprot:TRINITY_DN3657_c0_g2_i1.p1 TRINITY_DN3657_c0_g2~~TRINITY_DN3657_c0_g2_i1.p1  ORF type:complete len:662 (+),score=140.95 TRINITY_DN3657_c0_g2_i1:14-1999(+)